MRWLGGRPVYLDGKQVAEVTRIGPKFVVRNIRPNGTVGVCFEAESKQAIKDWLDSFYPGWTK